MIPRAFCTSQARVTASAKVYARIPCRRERRKNERKLSVIGNVLIMQALAGEMNMNYPIANLIAVTGCALVNFLLSDRLVFER